MPGRFVYYFGNGHADGGREDKALLGGKGANLAEMTRLGIPVPPGFTITTEVCRLYLRDKRYPEGSRGGGRRTVQRLEADTGTSLRRRRGSAARLGTQRCGGLDARHDGDDPEPRAERRDVAALARASGDERFAYDSYRRFVQMYGEVVLGVPHGCSSQRIAEAKTARGVTEDTGLTPADLRGLVRRTRRCAASASARSSRTIPRSSCGARSKPCSAPGTPSARSPTAACTASRSTSAPRSTSWPWCTATWATIPAPASCSRAIRRRASGRLFGEFLVNAQGEDVVAGIRDPISIDDMATYLPAGIRQLLEVQATLERHFRDMQDLEFTVERGRLFLLQTRTGKRTARAVLRIAVDMVEEGLISEGDAVLRFDPQQLDQLLHPMIDPDADTTCFRARPARVARRGVRPRRLRSRRGRHAGRRRRRPVVLVRQETSPDDFHGMVAARRRRHRARRHDLARGGRRAGHGQVLRGRRAGAHHRRGSRRMPCR
jgi:pyruvate, orthophosphate dikinase